MGSTRKPAEQVAGRVSGATPSTEPDIQATSTSNQDLAESASIPAPPNSTDEPPTAGSASAVFAAPDAQAHDDEPTVISQRATPTGSSNKPADDAEHAPRPTAPADLANSLNGQRLDHFELRDFVGGGGMGSVFRAIDTRLQREVAIKVLSREQAADDETLRRFQNEAQSAARLDHDNIARVFYVGEDGGLHFIVFEFIAGLNLRELVLGKGPLPLGDAVNYTMQIAQALAHASSRDVIHRDIKPSNVIVTHDGRVKLVDMGLARMHHLDASGTELTASGVTLGTFDYISPEQARDPRSADVRSDIYSLGCTLFFMLCGRPPFPEGTVLQKLLQHNNEEPPDPRELRPDLPAEASAVVRRMLAKDPRRRYQSPNDLIRDLLQLSDATGIPRPSSAPSVVHVTVAPRVSAWERHLPWVAPVAALLAIALVLELSDSPGQDPFSTTRASFKDGTSNDRAEERPSEPTSDGSGDADANEKTPFSKVDRTRGELTHLPNEGDDEDSRERSSNQKTTARDDGKVPPDAEQEDRGANAMREQVDIPRASDDAQGLLQGDGPGRAAVKPAKREANSKTRKDGPSSSRDADGARGEQESGVNPASDKRGSATSLEGDLPARGHAVGVKDSPTRPGTESAASRGKLATELDESNDTDEAGAVDDSNVSQGAPSTSNGTDRREQTGDETKLDTNDGVGRTATANTNSDSPTATDGQDVAPTLPGRLIVTQQVSGARQYSSLKAACSASKSGDVIELRFNGRQHEQPISLNNQNVTIVAAPGFEPVLVFHPDEIDPAKYARAMIMVNGGRMTLVNLALELDVPSPLELPVDTWSLIESQHAEEINLDHCSLTIRNSTDRARAYHQGVAFLDIKSAGARDNMMMNDDLPREPALRVQLKNCLARGEAVFLRANESQSIDFLWDNGFLVTTERLLSASGVSSAPRPGGQVRLDLRHLTASLGQGLCRQLTDSLEKQYALPLDVQASDCIFALPQSAILVEHATLESVDSILRQFTWRGERNCYQGVVNFWRVGSVPRSKPPLDRNLAEWQALWGISRESHSVVATVLRAPRMADNRPPHSWRSDDLGLDLGLDGNLASKSGMDGRDAGMDLNALPVLPADPATPSEPRIAPIMPPTDGND